MLSSILVSSGSSWDYTSSHSIWLLITGNWCNCNLVIPVVDLCSIVKLLLHFQLYFKCFYSSKFEKLSIDLVLVVFLCSVFKFGLLSVFLIYEVACSFQIFHKCVDVIIERCSSHTDSRLVIQDRRFLAYSDCIALP